MINNPAETTTINDTIIDAIFSRYLEKKYITNIGTYHNISVITGL